MRILVTVNLRFPPQGKSAEGEAEPKARPKGVVDGQQVNIPALPERCPRGTHGDNGVDPEAGPPDWLYCLIERSGPYQPTVTRLIFQSGNTVSQVVQLQDPPRYRHASPVGTSLEGQEY